MKFVLLYVPASLGTPLVVELKAEGLEVEEIFNVMAAEIEDCTKDLEGKSQEFEVLNRLRSTITSWMNTTMCYVGASNISLNYNCDKVSLYAVSGLTKEVGDIR